MMASVKASARKSLGEYKPLIVYPNGKTEVCEQSPERATVHTKAGVIRGNRMARGTTYNTRDEAITAAQTVINNRREEALARAAKFADRESFVKRVLQEARLWGYEG
jgi:hypothetical protein